VSLEKTPAYGGKPKRPRIWSFLAELFRMAVLFFLNRSWSKKTGNLMA
jgi:hypothetical protein